jgi:Ca-activated chloride channel homolog
VVNRGTAAILSPRPRLFSPILLICLALSVIATSAWAQFASGVSLVEVYATVTDTRGEPVSGLSAGDFVVEEDGVRQEVQTFAAGHVPLSLAIAIDRSFSVSPDRLAHLTVAVQRVLGELRPDDQVMLLAIGSEVETLTPLSTDHRAAYDALTGLQPWGTTPLFDATLKAIDAIQQGTGRRALLLITDGADRYSSATATEMVAYARTHDVLIYPVALRRAQPPLFAELASVTGGRSAAVADPRAVAATLSAIARELRQQYLLGYTPASRHAGRPGWRSIAVRVTGRPGLRVRARDGYLAR